ncbi:MAG: hypothetical protein K2I32_06115, partial [Alistipes sp.]|nr:hypothetical protein [Alistipes sp.]
MVRALLAGWLAVVPAGVFAQLDARSILRAQQRGEDPNIYGNNPYASGEDEENVEPQYSTKKQRIRQPVESYFFNDSLR